MRWMIHTIPHRQQRHRNVSDRVKRRDEIVEFRVSDIGDERMEALIAIHEIVEQTLCKSKGISIDQIDIFDFSFTGDGEPGNHVDSPYRDQHRVATTVEKIVAKKLGVNWNEYKRRVRTLRMKGVQI